VVRGGYEEEGLKNIDLRTARMVKRAGVKKAGVKSVNDGRDGWGEGYKTAERDEGIMARWNDVRTARRENVRMGPRGCVALFYKCFLYFMV